jgi:hypothetical protein
LKPKYKKINTITAVIILSVIVAGLLLPKIQALEPAEEELKNKAAFLISTFNNSNASVTQTISTLRERGIEIPQSSIMAFREAQVLADQSVIKNQEEKFSEATNLAVQALQKLKDALSIIYRTTNVTQTEQEINTQLTINLRNTIDRNYETLQRLENMTNSTATHGTNVTAITQKIGTIKANLEAATSSLNQGNISQAENETNQVETLIDELTVYFDSLAVSFKLERVAAYINNTEQRLSSLKQELNSVSNQLSSTAQTEASAAITQAENSLTKAKQFLNSQQVNQTIDELAKVQENEQTVTDRINAVAPTPTPTATLSTRSNTASLNASATKADTP